MFCGAGVKDILEVVGLALGTLAIVLFTLALWVLGIVIGIGVPVAIIAGAVFFVWKLIVGP